MPEETRHPENPAQESPAVQVRHTENTPRTVLTEIALGLEEEGIPVVFLSSGPESSRSASKAAAMASRLNVGIGLDWSTRRVALHHRDLPLEEPLFVLDGGQGNTHSFRRLGANAARLVKGDPLLFDDPENGSFSSEKRKAPSETPPQDHDTVTVLVERVLEALNVKP